jgi:hypothetical protein
LIGYNSLTLEGLKPAGARSGLGWVC